MLHISVLMSPVGGYWNRCNFTARVTSCTCQSATPKVVFANLFSNFGMARASLRAETQSHTCKL